MLQIGDLYLTSNQHRMKILLSVTWNISECPLIAHEMFTEIRISGMVQWPFGGNCCWMAGTFQWPFSIFFFSGGKNSTDFHPIKGFKVILSWITTHKIKKMWKKSCPRAGSYQVVLFLLIHKPVRYLYATLLYSSNRLIWLLICILF